MPELRGGQMTYRNWINGIGRGTDGRIAKRTCGISEFDGERDPTPGDEIALTGPGNVTVNVQWSATQNLNGIIELVQNGVVVATKTASVTSTSPATLSVPTVVPKSGWLVARRVATGGGEHYSTCGCVRKVGNAGARQRDDASSTSTG